MGGVVALDFALDHPELVRSLTLIEPPAFWVLPELDAETQADLDALESVPEDVSEEFLEEFVRVAGLLPPGESARDLPQWQTWVEHRRSLRALPAVSAHRDDPARLKALTAPVLLVKGTGSARYYHDIIDKLAAQLVNAEVAEWPAGHAPHLVSMEPFLERLTAFLEQPSTRQPVGDLGQQQHV
jgi:pimeloyl-ACP methyl ester carboxylesterase